MIRVRNERAAGFTIVELLIVVVVIAILAAITIVSYNGIQQRATASSLQSEVSQALKKVESLKTLSGTDTYPTSQANAGLSTSGSGVLSYFNEPISNTYCIESKKGTVSYSANSITKAVTAGECSTNGLIGWWKLNNTTEDASPNGFNGTASSLTTATGQNGQANTAYAFDGSTSSFTVPHAPALDTSMESVSFWAKPNNWSSASGSVFVSKRSNTDNGFMIFYVNVGANLAVDCGGATTGGRWNTNYTPPFTSWTHLVVVCSEKAGLKLYVNGVETFTRSPASVNRSKISSTGTLKFGQDPNGSGLSLNGFMDDVRIYDRPLSAGEAMKLYTANAQ